MSARSFPGFPDIGALLSEVAAARSLYLRLSDAQQLSAIQPLTLKGQDGAGSLLPMPEE